MSSSFSSLLSLADDQQQNENTARSKSTNTHKEKEKEKHKENKGKSQHTNHSSSPPPPSSSLVRIILPSSSSVSPSPSSSSSISPSPSSPFPSLFIGKYSYVLPQLTAVSQKLKREISPKTTLLSSSPMSLSFHSNSSISPSVVHIHSIKAFHSVENVNISPFSDSSSASSSPSHSLSLNRQQYSEWFSSSIPTFVSSTLHSFHQIKSSHRKRKLIQIIDNVINSHHQNQRHGSVGKKTPTDNYNPSNNNYNNNNNNETFVGHEMSEEIRKEILGHSDVDESIRIDDVTIDEYCEIRRKTLKRVAKHQEGNENDEEENNDNENENDQDPNAFHELSCVNPCDSIVDLQSSMLYHSDRRKKVKL